MWTNVEYEQEEVRDDMLDKLLDEMEDSAGGEIVEHLVQMMRDKRSDTLVVYTVDRCELCGETRIMTIFSLGLCQTPSCSGRHLSTLF